MAALPPDNCNCLTSGAICNGNILAGSHTAHCGCLINIIACNNVGNAVCCDYRQRCLPYLPCNIMLLKAIRHGQSEADSPENFTFLQKFYRIF
ncbi:MAG: hypothetical protein DU429_06675 [Candidatus Tokpelaia sp.]|nr:MAG: hypothetical protein DU430_07110 [Candidatus Tokpelaia sp.]KAA6206104.1 MAG: hypothetical protein DU429_06675 [Candidatus Tokpelaia sp.]